MKIPAEAKKVFQGVIFAVWQWQQKMFDGSLETFELLSRRGTVDIIAVVGNKIIILQQEQPTKPMYPSLPGGVIADGEPHLMAAKRELLEETGYKSDDFELLAAYEKVRSKVYHPEYIYFAKDCQKIAEQSLDAGEKIKVTFVNFDEFLQLGRNEKFLISPNFRALLYEALLDKEKRRELKLKLFP